MAIVKTIADVPAEPVQADGARGVTVRVVFGPKDHAPTFALRQFTLGPGGTTPFHAHPWEHEVVVQSGGPILVTESGETPLTVGQVVLVPPDETHCFRNPSDSDSAAFLCLVPIEHQA